MFKFATKIASRPAGISRYLPAVRAVGTSTPVSSRFQSGRGLRKYIPSKIYGCTCGRGKVLEQTGIKMANARLPSFRSQDT